VENGPKAKAVEPADSAREEEVNAAEAPGRIARRKLLEIGPDKAAALPVAVPAGDRVAPCPKLRLEQVHEKRVDMRRRKPHRHAVPGCHVGAEAVAVQTKLANRAKRDGVASKHFVSLRDPLKR
jgi:hypothetical protein